MTSAPWGYVVVRRPHSTTYAPAPRDRGNSTGGVNSVTWTEPGHYEVTMPGLANDTSAVAVSPLGTVPRRCVVGIWFTNGSEEVIDVACFTRTGAPVDSPFVLTFLGAGTQSNHPSPPGYGFSWADQPHANSDYLPSRKFNSQPGSSNPVIRLGTGHYQADFNALGSPGGNVQVTAVSSFAATCQATWAQSGLQMQADVKCRSTAAALTDQQFDIILTDHVGLKGEGGNNVAYLTANHPLAASYTAPPALRYSSAGFAPTIRRTGKGAYVVTLRGMPLGGAAVVTPTAVNATLCSIGSIATDAQPQRIGVRCFDRFGQPNDATFSLSYLR